MAQLQYIENDGALFRGVARGLPDEVWDPGAKAFVPYEGDVPKGVEWGEIIDEAAAQKIMNRP